MPPDCYCCFIIDIACTYTLTQYVLFSEMYTFGVRVWRLFIVMNVYFWSTSMMAVIN